MTIFRKSLIGSTQEEKSNKGSPQIISLGDIEETFDILFSNVFEMIYGLWVVQFSSDKNV